MPLIFRHGEKSWVNGRKPLNALGYQFDPVLIAEQDNLRRNITQASPPKVVYCSPFLRCRQTAAIVQEYYPEVEIFVDANLREYISYCHSNKNIELCPITRAHLNGQKLMETIPQLKARLTKVIKQPYFEQPDVWIITHGLCITYLHELYYGQPCRYPVEGHGVYFPVIA